MELANKRALITGGTRGIGAAIAVDLASRGASVAINGRQADDASESTLGRLRAFDRPCCFLPGDMGVEADVKTCVENAADTLGGLDILVHSAGGPSGGSIENVTTDQWMKTFDVHVHGAYFLCREGLPWLRQNREGAILLISSVAGIRGCPGAITYGTVKGAILQFTRMLARDLADDNIRVNCISPGIIRTRFHDKMTEQQQAHNLAHRIPLHREGTAEDVADACRMLICNEFMTGESVTIDGGMSMQVVR